MKKIICLLLAVCFAMMPVAGFAEEAVEISTVEVQYDAKLAAVCDNEKVEVGDQFLVSFVMEEVKPYLTFSMVGTFDSSRAEIVAPVYTNEVIGVLTNQFDNEKGTFKLEGYDQTIKGTKENVICSILFEAKAEGNIAVNLGEECMIGKANENAFYALDIESTVVAVSADTDGETTAIIEEPEPATPYDDMFGYDWAEKAVGVMYKIGALENIADTSFKPGENITRGEFITMLVRVCKLDGNTDIEAFGDVNSDSYQYEAVMIAKSLGIAKGDESGNFRPDENITRQDICALVFRTMLKMRKARSEIEVNDYLSGFDDADKISEYAKEPVAGLIRGKIIIGDNTGLLRPLDNMTRAEAAVLLNRLAEYNILIPRQ